MSDKIQVDKFIQPEDGWEIVERAPGPRTLLSPEAIQDGRNRVAMGEDIDEVAEDLAIDEVMLEESLLAGTGTVEPEGTETRALARRRREGAAHSAADGATNAITLVANAAFAAGRAAIDRRALVEALLAKDEASAYRAVEGAAPAVRAMLEATMPAVLARTAAVGFRTAASSLPRVRSAKAKVGVAMSFGKGQGDVRAATWAAAHAGELIKGLDETTVNDIREAITAALLNPSSPRQTYAAVLEAVGDPDRAKAIARTESMRAVNAGRREAWEEAEENGSLPPGMRRTWITAPACCDECETLEGATAPLDGQYPDPGGYGPPLHPNCRCSEGLV